MKRFYLGTVILCILLLTAGCNQLECDSHTAVLILRDATCPADQSQAEAAAVTRYVVDDVFGLEEGDISCNAYTLVTSEISDIAYSRYGANLTLGSVSALKMVKKTRKKQVNQFRSDIANAIEELFAKETGKEESKVWEGFISKVSYFTQVEANRRVLVCYSDLFQNRSGELNFYNISVQDGGKALVEAYDRVLASKFDALPPEASEIEFLFVHTPKNSITDERFRYTLEWTLRQLKARGINKIRYLPNL